jgi:hypothetical protein
MISGQTNDCLVKSDDHLLKMAVCPYSSKTPTPPPGKFHLEQGEGNKNNLNLSIFQLNKKNRCCVCVHLCKSKTVFHLWMEMMRHKVLILWKMIFLAYTKLTLGGAFFP